MNVLIELLLFLVAFYIVWNGSFIYHLHQWEKSLPEGFLLKKHIQWKIEDFCEHLKKDLF